MQRRPHGRHERHEHHIDRSDLDQSRLARGWVARGWWSRLRGGVAALTRRLRQQPADEGSEIVQVVIGIVFAVAAVVAIWKFLGPKLLEFAQTALNNL
jgi:hypothetical protein